MISHRTIRFNPLIDFGPHCHPSDKNESVSFKADRPESRKLYLSVSKPGPLNKKPVRKNGYMSTCELTRVSISFSARCTAIYPEKSQL